MNKRILIIDDEDCVCYFLAQYLRSQGFSVSIAETAQDACWRLEQDPAFELIILDLLLPDADGVQLSETFRERWPRIPVIVLTGVLDGQIAQELTRNGVVFCCPKTLGLKLLLERIETAIAVAALAAEDPDAQEPSLSTSCTVLSSFSLV